MQGMQSASPAVIHHITNPGFHLINRPFLKLVSRALVTGMTEWGGSRWVPAAAFLAPLRRLVVGASVPFAPVCQLFNAVATQGPPASVAFGAALAVAPVVASALALLLLKPWLLPS